VIVVDSSALLAILQEEGEADRCRKSLAENTIVAMSAGTLTEALIVASARGLDRQLVQMIDAGDFEIVPVDNRCAITMALAYRQWGCGFHPARLNFGDCFAYALAMDRGCPLLYVGDDFAQTDIIVA
jgi:ribonuclease VapC